jgi:hypothetical protein
MPALHGFIVEWPLATPMIGFSKSPSSKPTARSIARLGERATPSVIKWERLLSFVTAISFKAGRVSPSEAAAGRVGWVERSETHHGLFSAALPMMGFAALNPSYEAAFGIAQ